MLLEAHFERSRNKEAYPGWCFVLFAFLSFSPTSTKAQNQPAQGLTLLRAENTLR